MSHSRAGGSTDKPFREFIQQICKDIRDSKAETCRLAGELHAELMRELDLLEERLARQRARSGRRRDRVRSQPSKPA